VAVCPLGQIVTADELIESVGAEIIETFKVALPEPQALETVTVCDPAELTTSELVPLPPGCHVNVGVLENAFTVKL
jgi:hypothetical protein